MDDPPRARCALVVVVAWNLSVPRDPREELVDLSGVSLAWGVSPEAVALVEDFAENEGTVGNDDSIRGKFALDVPGGCPVGFVT